MRRLKTISSTARAQHRPVCVTSVRAVGTAAPIEPSGAAVIPPS
jgi:hypothetical protein